ncbi:MAG: GntR family transcriptional regulator [Chloroflexota bacterium]|nr:GntR family transcriptional regulator [Chloroflexota bacterium]
MQSPGPLAIAAKTREQATYEALRRAIVEGRWGQGEPLVGSRLADELGVSRITVMNALKRLAGEGFVQLSPHKGAVVARWKAADVREIYLMRAELEALVAREAARRIQPDDLVALRGANDAIGALVTRGAPVRDLRAADRRFHQQLYAVARMPFLAETLGNLADQCEGFRARLLDQRPIFVPTPERHLPILTALTANGDLAAAAMREHVLNGMRAVLASWDAETATGLTPAATRDEGEASMRR